MKQMVVLFALAAVACGSYIPLAQPPHHPAVVLDPHGRPLDTAEVIGARAVHLQAKALEGHHVPAVAVAPLAHSVVAPAVYAAPAAVSHQSRVDVHSSPAVVHHAVHAPVVSHAPVLAHAAYASPLLGHAAYGLGHGHLLKKRSLGHYAYSAPIVAPSAVSHQSRVDVISSPAVVSHAVHAPVVSHAVAAPVVAVAPAAAVSHQSRVDVRHSPTIVATAAVAPIAHSVVAAAPYAHGVYGAAPLAHSGYYHSSPLVHGW